MTDQSETETGREIEEFEGRDLRGAVFWGVDLTGAAFRDVNLTGIQIRQAIIADVEIDAFVDRVTINGVDVTDYVNQHDRWYPLRAMLRPTEPDAMRTAMAALDEAWAATIERARGLTDEQQHRSVNGEYSFVDTLRHVVFGADKWFTGPILGDASFSSIGLPNTGSIDVGFPGLDLATTPTFDEAVGVRRRQVDRIRAFLDELTHADLDREVVVLENGPHPLTECVQVVLEEGFEHHRYALRDLDVIEAG